MFRKINNKTLGIVFVLLLILVLAIYFFKDRQGERTFRSELVVVDTAQVTKIVLLPKALNGEDVVLLKGDDGWLVKNENGSYSADVNSVNTMLSEFSGMYPERVAARSKDKWADFQVDDSTATRVKVFNEDKMLVDLMIGKFSYQQPQNPYQRQGKMTSFVRICGEDETYAVDGFLSMEFNKTIDQLRNTTIINVDNSSVTSLDFTTRDESSYRLRNEKGVWLVDGIQADSVTVQNYLASISRTNGKLFNTQVNLPIEADYSL
ncbi:MAG: hypothetical protein C0594_15510 [Marinilabiliales bacterium]|nr:MAG: hypothetical protein C0594_15510 [Marinilabiliales bacterium]